MLLWGLPPGLFAFSGLYYDPEHSFALYCIFLRVSQEQFCGFLYVFNFVLNFSKALGFCQTLFGIYVRSLLIFSPISSSLSDSCIKLFRPESDSSSSDSLLVPKILFRLPASSLSSSAWRLTLSSHWCSDSSQPDLQPGILSSRQS